MQVLLLACQAKNNCAASVIDLRVSNSLPRSFCVLKRSARLTYSGAPGPAPVLPGPSSGFRSGLWSLVCLWPGLSIGGLWWPFLPPGLSVRPEFGVSACPLLRAALFCWLKDERPGARGLSVRGRSPGAAVRRPGPPSGPAPGGGGAAANGHPCPVPAGPAFPGRPSPLRAAAAPPGTTGQARRPAPPGARPQSSLSVPGSFGSAALRGGGLRPPAPQTKPGVRACGPHPLEKSSPAPRVEKKDAGRGLTLPPRPEDAASPWGSVKG